MLKAGAESDTIARGIKPEYQSIRPDTPHSSDFSPFSSPRSVKNLPTTPRSRPPSRPVGLQLAWVRLESSPRIELPSLTGSAAVSAATSAPTHNRFPPSVSVCQREVGQLGSNWQGRRSKALLPRSAKPDWERRRLGGIHPPQRTTVSRQASPCASAK